MATPVLLQHYRDKALPALREKLGYQNINQVPKIEKIVINTCVGNAAERKQAVEYATEELGRITGQRPAVTRAKKSVSNFKLREGDAVGARVTLRGQRMWEFLERFLFTAVPKIRDFRGISFKSFDGRGNYAIGVPDQSIFPEIELDKIKQTVGFDIVVVTTANTNDEALALLTEMGFPFRKKNTEAAAAH